MNFSKLGILNVRSHQLFPVPFRWLSCGDWPLCHLKYYIHIHSLIIFRMNEVQILLCWASEGFYQSWSAIPFSLPVLYRGWKAVTARVLSQECEDTHPTSEPRQLQNWFLKSSWWSISDTKEWLMKPNTSLYLGNPHSQSPCSGYLCSSWAPWWPASPWLELHLQECRGREFLGTFNSICTHQDSFQCSQSHRAAVNWDLPAGLRLHGHEILHKLLKTVKKHLEICSICCPFILFIRYPKI